MREKARAEDLEALRRALARPRSLRGASRRQAGIRLKPAHRRDRDRGPRYRGVVWQKRDSTPRVCAPTLADLYLTVLSTTTTWVTQSSAGDDTHQPARQKQIYDRSAAVRMAHIPLITADGAKLSSAMAPRGRCYRAMGYPARSPCATIWCPWLGPWRPGDLSTTK